jgi:hypothetical protein
MHSYTYLCQCIHSRIYNKTHEFQQILVTPIHHGVHCNLLLDLLVIHFSDSEKPISLPIIYFLKILSHIIVSKFLVHVTVKENASVVKRSVLYMCIHVYSSLCFYHYSILFISH